MTKLAKQLHRKERVDELLYNDAVAKRSRRDSPAKGFTPEAPSSARGPSKNQARYVSRRFDRNFDKVFAEIDMGTKGKLGFPEMCMLLQKLGCIEQFEAGKEKEMMQALWDILSQGKEGEIEKQTMCAALKQILRVEADDGSGAGSNVLSSKTWASPRSLSSSPAKEVRFLPQGLHKKFYQLYIRYRYQRGLEKDTPSPEKDKMFPFRPNISERSRTLASASKGTVRTKWVERKVGELSSSPGKTKSPNKEPVPKQQFRRSNPLFQQGKQLRTETEDKKPSRFMITNQPTPKLKKRETPVTGKRERRSYGKSNRFKHQLVQSMQNEGNNGELKILIN